MSVPDHDIPTGEALDPEALRVANALLRQTGEALLSRDAARFAAAFSLPHRISTFDRTVVIETPGDLIRTFDKACAEYAKLGVTDCVRDCIAARFRDPDTIAHTHISHLMRGPWRVKDPYPCFSSLKRQDGVWRVHSSDYAIDSTSSYARALTILASEARA